MTAARSLAPGSMRHPAPSRPLDPAGLEVMWRRLITAMDETDQSVKRTAFSTIIGESGDYACVLLDGAANGIAQSTVSTTSFTLTIPITVRHVLRVLPPASLADGDVLVCNDPWHGAGHLPDINVIKPVFHGGRLVAYITTCAHLPDIGGHRGYFNASEVYEEGLFIPPSRLYRAGAPNEEVIRLIQRNVRGPEMVIGDLRGIVSAQNVGARRIQEFLDDYGAADLTSISAEVLHRSERAARDAIRVVPDGVYRNEVEADAFDELLRVCVAVTVRGDEVTVDLTGSSPQFAYGATNNTMSSTRGAVMVTLKSIFVPEIPNNEGQFAPMDVQAPPGSAFNAAFPVAVQARSVAKVHLTEAIHGALAPVCPDRVCGGSSTFWSFHVRGRSGGKLQKNHLIPDGGMGGRSTKDGLSCIRYPGNGSVAPIEVFENRAPVLIERKELAIDSAGPGRNRGGIGQRIDVRALDDAEITIRPNNIHVAAPGVLGGHEAPHGDYRVNGERVPLEPRKLRAGDTVRLSLPGGGGFGDPRTRDPGAVLRDVAYGFVSVESAAERYGVMIRPDGDAPDGVVIDEAATAAARAMNRSGD